MSKARTKQQFIDYLADQVEKAEKAGRASEAACIANPNSETLEAQCFDEGFHDGLKLVLYELRSLETEPKATNFDYRISRELAEYLLANDCLAPGCDIMCKEYGEDKDWCGLQDGDLEDGKLDEDWKTLEISAPIPGNMPAHAKLDIALEIMTDRQVEEYIKQTK